MLGIISVTFSVTYDKQTHLNKLARFVGAGLFLFTIHPLGKQWPTGRGEQFGSKGNGIRQGEMKEEKEEETKHTKGK